MRANKYSEEEIAIVRAAGLELPGVTGEERRAGWKRVLDQHPELFWIIPNMCWKIYKAKIHALADSRSQLTTRMASSSK